MCWPTPGLKGRTFKLCVLNRWDFNICVRSSPLRGEKERKREKKVMRRRRKHKKKASETCAVFFSLFFSSTTLPPPKPPVRQIFALPIILIMRCYFQFTVRSPLATISGTCCRKHCQASCITAGLTATHRITELVLRVTRAQTSRARHQRGGGVQQRK